MRIRGSLGAQRLLMGQKRWAMNLGVLGYHTDSWSMEIVLVTHRLHEDPGVVWRPVGHGGAPRFFSAPEIVLETRRFS
ncbi:hypothetical protein F2Q68_00021062 [Brassica cretica]|uniref:Uncharacterized protein n=1 Tax=Brassica cretica TaxID=69181 RepID=A0A8S9FQM5_BRACR|nr:hypothetical protein F2Q68_00021062 [Brassica cretica]